MEIEVSLKDLIETIVDITVEHYVDTFDDEMCYSHKRIYDDNIDSMKKDLIKKLNSILKEEKKKE